MREYTPRSRGTLTLAAVIFSSALLLSACGEKKTDGTALNADSALGRDLALAARDSAAQPKLEDVPAPAPTPAPTPEPAAPVRRPTPKPAPRPAAAAPTPAPAAAPAPTPAAPTTGVVAAGMSLNFAANQRVCSNTTQVGEKFTADLTESVAATNGFSIPAGATGTFEVVAAKTAQNSNDNTLLTVRLVAVQYGGRSYAVESTVQTVATDRVRSASKGTDAKKVAGGAVIGAIAGQILGKNTKGTVIGAAAGAAAGTAAAAATANYDTCISSGAVMSVKLDAAATVRAPNAP